MGVFSPLITAARSNVLMYSSNILAQPFKQNIHTLYEQETISL